MKKIILSVALSCAINAVTAQSFHKKDNMEYRRSSLYTIMIPSDKLTGTANDIVTLTFDTLSIPDKYNDHNLGIRHIDLTKIEVSKEEIKAVKENADVKRTGIGGFLTKAGRGIGGATRKVFSNSQNAQMSDKEKVAKILKFFRENHIANKLIEKWYNKQNSLNKDGSHFNMDRIHHLGLVGASVEEINKHKETIEGERPIMDAAALDLIPRTFIMVTSYAYSSPEEVAEYANKLSENAKAKGDEGFGALTGLVGSVASLVGDISKGHLVTATSYLFQLDWNEEIMKKFYDKYWNATNTREFDMSDEFTISYVGQTTSQAWAGASKVKDTDKAHAKSIGLATVRATDACIARLQSRYPVFKTLTSLNVADDGTMYAYIGKKEGVKGGDEYDVLEQVPDGKGGFEYENVGTVEVEKGKVWDNRAGVGIDGDIMDEKEKKDIDPNASYTVLHRESLFTNKVKKDWTVIGGGLFIKLK